jgi:hypothetical protein
MASNPSQGWIWLVLAGVLCAATCVFCYRKRRAGENTEQDVRMCVLVLLGVSHKETAELLNCSPKSVGKLKDLTAHKLGVSGGQLRQKMEEICPI